jgi:GINS complex subunit 2
MAGQSDPHLSIFSPSEVTNPSHLVPPTYRQRGRDAEFLQSVLQVEFVAEDEIVDIVPNIRMDALNMICVRLRLPPISISLHCRSPILHAASHTAAATAV